MHAPAGAAALRALPRCHLSALLLPPACHSGLRREASGRGAGGAPPPYALLTATLPDGTVSVLPWFHAAGRRLLLVGNVPRGGSGGGGEDGSDAPAATRQWLGTRGVGALARWDRRDATRTGLLLLPGAPVAAASEEGEEEGGGEGGRGAAAAAASQVPSATRLALLCSAGTPLARAFALAVVGGGGARFSLHFVPLSTWVGGYTARARQALRESKRRDQGV